MGSRRRTVAASVVASLAAAGLSAASCSLQDLDHGTADAASRDIGVDVDAGGPRGDAGADVTVFDSGGVMPEDSGDVATQDSATADVQEVSTPGDGDAARQADGAMDGPGDVAAPEPIAFVQGNSVDVGAVTAGVLQVGQSSAHDLVVLVLSYTLTGAADPQVTDTLGDSYQVVLGPLVGADGYSRYLYYAEDIASGLLSITATLPQAPSGSFQMYSMEYSGIVRTGAFDVARWNTGTSMAVDGMASGTATTHFPRELIFGYGEAGAVAAGTGFSPRETVNANVAEDMFVTSIGSYQATGTSQFHGGWIMMMATFAGN